MSHPRTLSQQDLLDILERHRLWMASGGGEGERADLRNLVLTGRSLWRADLRDALLDGCDLSGADLDHADLRGASLEGARLTDASLWEAKLTGALLTDAVLWGANLDHADLRGADLSGADTTGASIRSALRSPDTATDTVSEPEAEPEEPPADLDSYRGLSAQKATEQRRESAEVAAENTDRHLRQDRLEKALSAQPAETWLDLAEKAQYLIAMFARTAEGQDPRHQRLIAAALADIDRLSKTPPPS